VQFAWFLVYSAVHGADEPHVGLADLHILEPAGEPIGGRPHKSGVKGL